MEGCDWLSIFKCLSWSQPYRSLLKISENDISFLLHLKHKILKNVWVRRPASTIDGVNNPWKYQLA